MRWADWYSNVHNSKTRIYMSPQAEHVPFRAVRGLERDVE